MRVGAIDTRDDRMAVGVLAKFAAGMSWQQILALTRGGAASWWREVVMQAEDDGLLAWDRKRHVWRLTEVGRSASRDVA